MICEICGKEYRYSCASCTKRIMTWGQDGLLYLMELAKSENDMQAGDLIPIVNVYYQGQEKVLSNKTTILKTALKSLGYKGKFLGRIHVNGTVYEQIRKRELAAGRRWGLRNETCDKCGSKEALRLHHVVPLSWGGVTSDENCVTLCERCHRETHKKLSKLLSRERLLSYISQYQEEINSLAKQSI